MTEPRNIFEELDYAERTGDRSVVDAESHIRELASFHDGRCPSLVSVSGGRILVDPGATCPEWCGGKARAHDFRRQGGKVT